MHFFLQAEGWSPECCRSRWLLRDGCAAEKMGIERAAYRNDSLCTLSGQEAKTSRRDGEFDRPRFQRANRPLPLRNCWTLHVRGNRRGQKRKEFLWTQKLTERAGLAWRKRVARFERLSVRFRWSAEQRFFHNVYVWNSQPRLGFSPPRISSLDHPVYWVTTINDSYVGRNCFSLDTVMVELSRGHAELRFDSSVIRLELARLTLTKKPPGCTSRGSTVRLPLFAA